MASEPPAKKMKAVVKDPQHCKRLVLSLQAFNAQNNFTDLCFVCARGHKVYAHKLLLCSVSSLLKQIFLDIPDNLQQITIHLPDVESRLLSLMFDFLYEGSVRVNKFEYSDFQKVMDMLGIVLTIPNNECVSTPTSQPPPPPQPAPPQQQIQSSQLVYLQTPPNSQGQVQYMLAAPASLAQGQMVGVSPVVQGNMVTQPSPQPIIMSPNTGQMVQAGSQVVTPQVQQNNLMQMVQQNSGQVVPVQCATQMVVQGGQQTIMANNQVQVVGMQNTVAQGNYTPTQPIQQRPQYVPVNQMATPSRQYSQPSGTVQSNRGRAKTIQQQPRIVNSNEISSEDIISVLQESGDDVESLTARTVREQLEVKLNVDLSGQEDQIDQVLRACLRTTTMGPVESILPDIPSTSEVARPTKQKKKRGLCFTNSDDEKDEDFIPKITKKRGRKKKNA